ncbi:hypothetical protein LJR175_008228 [Variovorax sp. LjRoot175]|uniref:hypothetical protein n=1 Tax=Variovorax sp. LjRoot175 TaxID=3342276 RepID=UPI003ECDA310
MDEQRIKDAPPVEIQHHGVMALRCAGCGANLEVDPEVDHFTCGYCRTPQEVVRRGGIVLLKKLGDAISRVQRGTDKTAAELAIPRLEREILELESKRVRDLAAPVRVRDRTRLSNAVIAMVSGFAIFFFVMIAMASAGRHDGLLIYLVWVLWIGCFFGSIVGYICLRSLRHGDKAKAKAQRDKAINAECEREIAKIRDRLAQARAVADAH